MEGDTLKDQVTNLQQGVNALIKKVGEDSAELMAKAQGMATKTGLFKPSAEKIAAKRSEASAMIQNQNILNALKNKLDNLSKDSPELESQVREVVIAAYANLFAADVKLAGKDVEKGPYITQLENLMGPPSKDNIFTKVYAKYGENFDIKVKDHKNYEAAVFMLDSSGYNKENTPIIKSLFDQLIIKLYAPESKENVRAGTNLLHLLSVTSRDGLGVIEIIASQQKDVLGPKASSALINSLTRNEIKPQSVYNDLSYNKDVKNGIDSYLKSTSGVAIVKEASATSKQAESPEPSQYRPGSSSR